MHEIDSALGFYLLNNPRQMTDVESFFNAAHYIDYTFNWFFANPHHIAYLVPGKWARRKWIGPIAIGCGHQNGSDQRSHTGREDHWPEADVRNGAHQVGGGLTNS